MGHQINGVETIWVLVGSIHGIGLMDRDPNQAPIIKKELIKYIIIIIIFIVVVVIYF